MGGFFGWRGEEEKDGGVFFSAERSEGHSAPLKATKKDGRLVPIETIANEARNLEKAPRAPSQHIRRKKKTRGGKFPHLTNRTHDSREGSTSIANPLRRVEETLGEKRTILCSQRGTEKKRRGFRQVHAVRRGFVKEEDGQKKTPPSRKNAKGSLPFGKGQLRMMRQK